MHWFSKARDLLRRSRGSGRPESHWVRAIPGAVPRSPLESRVHEILAAQPVCGWERLLVEVAQYLRRSEPPLVLVVLEEAIWGGWLWPIVAREELRRLEGVLLSIEKNPGACAPYNERHCGLSRPASAGSRDMGCLLP